jgi:hypothetical protein
MMMIFLNLLICELVRFEAIAIIKITGDYTD